MGKIISRANRKGFTLIELMIAVAIVGILFAIALPSYRNYVLRSHRVDARNTLQAAAQKLEQNYSANRRYDQDSKKSTIDNSTLVVWGLNQSPAGDKKDARYTISFVGDKPGASEYTLQAKPTDRRKGDECGTITLNQSNARTAGGKGTSDPLSQRCWTR